MVQPLLTTASSCGRAVRVGASSNARVAWAAATPATFSASHTYTPASAAIAGPSRRRPSPAAWRPSMVPSRRRVLRQAPQLLLAAGTGGGVGGRRHDVRMDWRGQRETVRKVVQKAQNKIRTSNRKKISLSYQTQYSPCTLRSVGLACCLKPAMFLALQRYSTASWGHAPGSTSSPATPKEACEPLGHLGAI